MTTISKSFTATGSGASINIKGGDSFTYAVSGTFVGTVQIEESFDGGATWHTIGISATGSASGTFIVAPKIAHSLYRFTCTAYTSGTIVTSLVDASQVLQEWYTNDGSRIAYIDESGFNGPLVGASSNTDANTGALGEYTTAAVATGSAVSLTTGTAATVTSLSLSAGDYEVSGIIAFKPGATTSITVMGAAISQTTNAVPATIAQGASGEMLVQIARAAFVPGANDTCVQVSPIRISLSATTTIYLVAKSTFTVSTLAAYGMMKARRVR